MMPLNTAEQALTDDEVVRLLFREVLTDWEANTFHRLLTTVEGDEGQKSEDDFQFFRLVALGTRDPEQIERIARTSPRWLVHLRNLVAFFRTKQDQGDEVLACHFMDDPAQWARDHEAELQLTDEERERVARINHLVAHITYERPKLQSDFGPHDHKMVIKRLRIFYATLPPRHKPRFPRLAALVQ